MQMLLNKKKSKVMNFNFTKNYQFSSRLKLDNEVLETISETKLLGVMINDKLTWDSNTSYIVKRANGRMRMLHKLVKFNVPVEDLITIYILYIRSVLEQSCQVWHSSLTFENLTDLERVQKNALKIILRDNYISYESALDKDGIQCLVERREILCLKFAKSCVKHHLMKNIFPLNDIEYHIDTRNREVYKESKASTIHDQTFEQPSLKALLVENIGFAHLPSTKWEHTMIITMLSLNYLYCCKQ